MLLNTLVIIGEVFGMHHQLGGSTEDDMNKMSVIGHISQKRTKKLLEACLVCIHTDINDLVKIIMPMMHCCN